MGPGRMHLGCGMGDGRVDRCRGNGKWQGIIHNYPFKEYGCHIHVYAEDGADILGFDASGYEVTVNRVDMLHCPALLYLKSVCTEQINISANPLLKGLICNDCGFFTEVTAIKVVPLAMLYCAEAVFGFLLDWDTFKAKVAECLCNKSAFVRSCGICLLFGWRILLYCGGDVSGWDFLESSVSLGIE